MFNEVILAGKISSDANLKYSQGGLAILSFSLETKSSHTNKEGERVENSEYHRIVAFGSVAEIELYKGDMVFVSGRIKSRKYQDRDGNERYITEINANRIVNLLQEQQSAEPQPQQRQQPVRQQQQKPTHAYPPPDSSYDIDSVPF